MSGPPASTSAPSPPPAADPPGKWRALLLIAAAELLVMTLWFSASAVVPQLSAEWEVDAALASWLTMSVQLGFVAGALASALLNLADRVRPHALLATCALVAAAANAAIPALDPGPAAAIGLRLVTGAALAGVYPPGMKLAASWSTRDRGLAIGLLVGALTVGTAGPHLLNAVPLWGGAAGMPPWRSVMLATSGLAVAGAAVAAAGIRPGPHLGGRAPFRWAYAARALAHRPTRLANLGYLGHMWELYAMWTWVPALLLASYERAGWAAASARMAAFAAIGAGALGCVAAGVIADRAGRTATTSASMIASGGCAVIAGLCFEHPAALTAVCVVWGIAVVADSAQFSAAISELTDARYVGTALTVQTALGFLLTLVSIRALPPLLDALGWRWGFAALALGPAAGTAAMLRLRALPEAAAMAGGNR